MLKHCLLALVLVSVAYALVPQRWRKTAVLTTNRMRPLNMDEVAISIPRGGPKC